MLIELADRSIRVAACQSIAPTIAAAFPTYRRAPPSARAEVEIRVDGEGRFTVEDAIEPPATCLTRGDVMTFAMDSIVRTLVWDLRSDVALHAGAVSRGDTTILIPGHSGAGKSSLTAWLVEQGYEYVTDEVVVLDKSGTAITGLKRAMVLKPGAAEHVAEFSRFRRGAVARAGTHELFYPTDGSRRSTKKKSCALIVFPQFTAGAETEIRVLTSGEAAVRLIECNLNARNFADSGFRAISSLARNATAVMLRYGAFSQLTGVLDTLVDIAVAGQVAPDALRSLLSVVSGRPVQDAKPSQPAKAAAAARSEIPAPTPIGRKRKLTIGMATYDDYDGAYFSAQAIRLYHPEVTEDTEVLVVDNHPEGRCAPALKRLDQKIRHCRYVPLQGRTGTAVRDFVFSEASGEFVLCLDSHVLLQPGSLKRLLDYFEQNPDTNDLLQGPLVNEQLSKIFTHFHPVWRNGMYGYWETDERGLDPDAAPFDIPMQGLGLFACRKEAWLGFNPLFRGFGGEEGYIHEKFRQRGARAICLPFLRWVHRFDRPNGVPYPMGWADRIRNYIIGHRELGLPEEELITHFKERIGDKLAGDIIASVKAEFGWA